MHIDLMPYARLKITLCWAAQLKTKKSYLFV